MAMWKSNSRKACNDGGTLWITHYTGKFIFKENPCCRISQKPWILMCSVSSSMKPDMGRNTFLRKLTVLRCDKTLCFKLALSLSIWFLPFPVVSIQGSLANMKAVRRLILMYGFSWLFCFRTTFLLKWDDLTMNKDRFFLCVWAMQQIC